MIEIGDFLRRQDGVVLLAVEQIGDNLHKCIIVKHHRKHLIGTPTYADIRNLNNTVFINPLFIEK